MSTFGTLQSIDFTEGPTATQVSGSTATVEFATVAHHDTYDDPKIGTAALVREGSEWKIDGLSVS